MPDTAPKAFMSYTRFDDQHNGGRITQFRTKLGGEVQAQTGEPFEIFQDNISIAWGENWKDRTLQTINEEVVFFIPIVTPSFFTSSACCEELDMFVQRQELIRQERSNDTKLIFPVYYIKCKLVETAGLRNDNKHAQTIVAAQYADWRDLRHEEIESQPVRERLEVLAVRIQDVLEQNAGRA